VPEFPVMGVFVPCYGIAVRRPDRRRPETVTGVAEAPEDSAASVVTRTSGDHLYNLSKGPERATRAASRRLARRANRYKLGWATFRAQEEGGDSLNETLAV